MEVLVFVIRKPEAVGLNCCDVFWKLTVLYCAVDLGGYCCKVAFILAAIPSIS